jgi:hypothetical protein
MIVDTFVKCRGFDFKVKFIKKVFHISFVHVHSFVKKKNFFIFMPKVKYFKIWLFCRNP